jgi:hypothetical protein
MSWGMLRGRGARDEGARLPAFRRARLTAENVTWLLVALGVVLRMLEYGDNRNLYMDESSLLKNLVGFAITDFTTTLTEFQLAPPGFLALERLMVRLPLAVVPAARLVPLLCSIASMFLMRSVARRYLTPRAVPIAVGLFALNDWLLYYSAEIKQYSADVALTLLALLLAAGWSSGPDVVSRRRLLVLADFGIVGVLFSYPLALVLAGVGTYLIAEAAARRNWRQALGFVAVSLTWALSFGICYRISHKILSKERFIWDWWDFAFLRLPPRSFAELTGDFWQVLNVFDTPSGLRTPLGVIPSALFVMGLFLVGGFALGRRWKGGLYLVLAPMLFAILASTLRQYPFHGRLLLFLVPSIHLLVGEGAAVVARCGGAPLTCVLGAFLLFQPSFDMLWYRLIADRLHTQYDSHGDLSHDLLDYLETRRNQRPGPPSPP